MLSQGNKPDDLVQYSMGCKICFLLIFCSEEKIKTGKKKKITPNSSGFIQNTLYLWISIFFYTSLLFISLGTEKQIILQK